MTPVQRAAAIEAGARAAFIVDSMQDPEFVAQIWDDEAHDHSVKRHWRGVVAAVIAAAAPHLTGDEHHTLDELYLYRMLYHAHAANEWARRGTFPVVKSRRHSDGEPCFGGGWFIVVATLPAGQVSNHYTDEFWNLFDVPEVDLPPLYDGHTPAVAAERLLGALIPMDEEGQP